MKNKIAILGIFLALLSSCNVLDESLKNKVNEKEYFTTIDDARLAVNGCYSYLTNKQYQDANWWGLFQFPTVMTDEVTCRESWNGPVRNVCCAYQVERDPGTYKLWIGSYAAINWANRTINGIEALADEYHKFHESANKPVEGEGEALMARHLGEAKFIRALFYFNLVRFFNDVPLLLKPGDDIQSISVGRTPAYQVYQQIIKDLEDAKAGLPERSAVKPGQATKGAASALLAKVYVQMAGRPLYLQDYWQKAKDELDYFFTLSGYSLYESYFNIFHPDHENNSEIIFDAQFGEGDVYGHNLGMYFTGISGKFENGGRGNTLAVGFIVPEHVDKYKKSKDGVRDPRYDRNIGDKNMAGASDVIDSPISNPKEWTIKKFARCQDATHGYKNSWNVSGCPTNVPILRVADMYLLYAEVINELNGGPDETAYKYINMVRRRAWGRDINTADENVDLSGMDYDTFRRAIMDERSVELCFEGHRWFDLVRWNKLVEFVKGTTQVAADNINERSFLYPIPEEERLMNPNLSQNPGWAGGSPLEF